MGDVPASRAVSTTARTKTAHLDESATESEKKEPEAPKGRLRRGNSFRTHARHLMVVLAFDTNVHAADGGERRDALTSETHADGAQARVLRRLPVAVPTPANAAVDC